MSTFPAADTETHATAIRALAAMAADPEEWPDLLAVLAGEGSQAPGWPHDLDNLTPAQAPTPAAADVILITADLRGLQTSGPRADAQAERIGLAPWTEEAKAVIRRARKDASTAGGAPVLVRFDSRDGSVTLAYAVSALHLPVHFRETLAPQPDGGWPGDTLALILPDDALSAGFWESVGVGFGLTPAEQRLTTLLTSGQTLKDAAQQLNVSQNTVRNQLAAVFAKTGLQRQSDLVRSLTSLSALSASLTMRENVTTNPDTARQMAPEREMFRLKDGRRLGFREYGSANGRPVLIFHAGLGASLLPPDTHRLARTLGLRVIAVERPGVGRSDPLPGYSLQGVARSVAEFCQAMDLGPLQMCSVTSGARFAVATAALMGKDATRLLMISPRLPRPGASDQAVEQSPMVSFQNRIGRHLWLLEPLFSIIRHRLTRPMMSRIMHASALGEGDADYLRAHPDLTALLTEAMQETLSVTVRGTVDELRSARAEPWPDAGAVSASIAVWHGEEDTYAAPEHIEDWVGAYATEVRVFPGIGNYLGHAHWPDALKWLSGAN